MLRDFSLQFLCEEQVYSMDLCLLSIYCHCRAIVSDDIQILPTECSLTVSIPSIAFVSLHSNFPSASCQVKSLRIGHMRAIQYTTFKGLPGCDPSDGVAVQAFRSTITASFSLPFVCCESVQRAGVEFKAQRLEVSEVEQ
jgi:hypothetical protein